MTASSPPVVRPADLLRRDAWQFEYRQKCVPGSSNLSELSYGTYRITPAGQSDELYHHSQECLLFCLEGEQIVEVDGQSFPLSHYDMLYVPLATAYRITAVGELPGLLAVFRAPATVRHPVYHAEWARVARDESRIRHLDGKDVFLTFNVSEPADRLIAGFTIYRPQARAWPPHNHTDQEEIYLFTKGRGTMEVYADEESKSFVHDMQRLDAVTIPVMNWHPVASHDEEMHFIWCLCGARYWIGDKHKSFMDGSVEALTT